MLSVLILSAMVEIVFYLAPSLITRLLFGRAFVAISGQLPLYGMAMLLLSIAYTLIVYFLAIGNRTFVIVVFLACALQAGLIVWHHAEIAQLVLGVLTADTALGLALLIAWIVVVYRGIKPHYFAQP